MRAIGLTCLAGTLWGTVGVATQLVGGGHVLDPMASALSRTVLGALVLLAAAPLLTRKPGGGPVPWYLVAAFGVAGATFQLTLFASYPLVGVTIAVTLTACLPLVVVALWDALVVRNPPGLLLSAAVLLTGTGVVLAGLGSEAHDCAAGCAASMAGLALVLTSSLAFGGVTIVGRALAARMHPIRAAGLGLAATAAVILTFAAGRLLAVGMAPVTDGTALSPRDLVLLAYVGLIATGGAYLAFVTGLGRARSATAGLAPTLVEPVVAAVLAALLLQEHTTARGVAGCLMVLAGILLLTFGEARRRALPSGADARPVTEAEPTTP